MALVSTGFRSMPHGLQTELPSTTRRIGGDGEPAWAVLLVWCPDAMVKNAIWRS